MASEIDAQPLPRRKPVQHEPAARELLRAADLIRGALNPVALAGNGAVRAGAAPALREFVRATGIPVAETFMGKGLIDPEDPKALGSVGLQAGDYKMAGFEEAPDRPGGPHGAGCGRPAGGRLKEGGLRGGRRRDRDRLRPRGAVAADVDPVARKDDRLHRPPPRRDRRVLRARGRARRRYLP